MQTDVLLTTTSGERASAIEIAVESLRSGDIVALPTETVYGLAADALKSDAVLKIFEAKQRPAFNPLIVHLPDLNWLKRVVRIDHAAEDVVARLTNQYWPGPLTLVLPRSEIVPDLVTARLETVAVRISAQPLFAEIIRHFGSPLAAPSANLFGRISPTTAQHVLEELGGRIPLIIDSGPTAYGIESTVVALRQGRIELLRRGPVTTDELSQFGEVVIAQSGPRPEAPGQLSSHYAPSTPLVLIDDAASFAVPSGKRCGLLTWRPRLGAEPFSEVRHLGSGPDFREAAANLFRYLRELDRLKLDLIVAERLPDEGIGAAINDRLTRAASRE